MGYCVFFEIANTSGNLGLILVQLTSPISMLGTLEYWLFSSLQVKFMCVHLYAPILKYMHDL